MSSSANDLFDMSAVLGMINALYEMDEDEQSAMSSGTLLKQSSQLLKGLEAVQSQMESVSDLATQSAIETKLYDLRRVIDVLDEMVRLNKEDIHERKATLFKSFFDVKRDAKAILETLTSLDNKGRTKEGSDDKESAGQRPGSSRRSSFDIGFAMQDVLSMIEALGRPDDDDLESVMSPKDIKTRSMQILTSLSDVLQKLESFLANGSYDTSVTDFGAIIHVVEGHIATLRRIQKVLLAIEDSPLDEVELAIFQEYSSYGDLQQEAREVMESIYSIQFGEEPPRRAESKDYRGSGSRSRSGDEKDQKGGRDDKDDYGDDLDVKSELNYTPSRNRFSDDVDLSMIAATDFGFDFGAVMGMLHELGAHDDDDDDDGAMSMMSPSDVRQQSTTMAKSIEQVIETISPSMRGRRGLGMASSESIKSEDSKRSSSYPDRVIEEALFDLQHVLDILQQLINCDDNDDDGAAMTRSDSFKNLKGQVKQVIQRVVSLGSVGMGSHNSSRKMRQDESRQSKDGGDDEGGADEKELGRGQEDKDGYIMPSQWADLK